MQCHGDTPDFTGCTNPATRLLDLEDSEQEVPFCASCTQVAIELEIGWVPSPCTGDAFIAGCGVPSTRIVFEGPEGGAIPVCGDCR